MGLVGRLGRVLGPGRGAPGAPSADFLSNGVAVTSCKKARQRAPKPPNARAPRARRSLGRPDAAQQRPRAPGGVKRALSTCTRPLHAPTAYANAPPSTPPPPVERACARSSARAPRASPALRPVLPGTRPRKRRRGPFGPEVEKSSGATPSGRRPCRENPSRAAQPRPIGTGTCGGAARSQRAQDLAERPKPARAVEEDLSGYARTGHVFLCKAPVFQPYPSAP